MNTHPGTKADDRELMKLAPGFAFLKGKVLSFISIGFYESFYSTFLVEIKKSFFAILNVGSRLMNIFVIKIKPLFMRRRSL